ncbi:MAG: hypothetical protein QM796_06480 [Chthoniobacteraceae bacterium]
MKTFLPCLLLAFWVAMPALPAQSANTAPAPVLPPGPLLKPVPDFVKWTVTRTSKSSGAKPEGDKKPGYIETIVGARTGPMVHVIRTEGNGGRWEFWSNGKTQVIINGSNAPLISTGLPDEYPLPTWISSSNFTELKTVGKKQYLIFHDRVFPFGGEITADMVAPGVDLESLKVEATASIDAETRLPVGVQLGSETIAYKFEALPSGTMQSFPPEVLATIAQHQQKLEAMIRKPVQP